MKPILACYPPGLMHTSTMQPFSENIGMQACHDVFCENYVIPRIVWRILLPQTYMLYIIRFHIISLGATLHYFYYIFFHRFPVDIKDITAVIPWRYSHIKLLNGNIRCTMDYRRRYFLGRFCIADACLGWCLLFGNWRYWQGSCIHETISHIGQQIWCIC